MLKISNRISTTCINTFPYKIQPQFFTYWRSHTLTLFRVSQILNEAGSYREVGGGSAEKKFTSLGASFTCNLISSPC